MKETLYESWLKKQGISSYKNYISRTKRIESFYGNIDDEYDKDGCSSLLIEFVYTNEDRAHKRKPQHKISFVPLSDNDIYQSYYEGTKDFASRVKKYIEFREDIQDEQFGRFNYLDNSQITSSSELLSDITNPSSVVLSKSKRNARYKKAPIGNAQNSVIRTILSNLGNESFTEKDWESTKEFFDGKCVYCGNVEKDIVRDHAIPISRYKLGEHRLGNIVPACKNCNSKKGEKDYIEFCSENKTALEKINEYMKSRGYIPITDDEEKSDNVRIVLHKAHEEIRAVVEKYIELINDLFFK